MQIYSAKRLCEIIDDYVHDARYREILKMRFCENFTYEVIAEEVGFSTQYTKEIVKRYKTMLFSLL